MYYASEPMSIEQIKRHAPSAFAVNPSPAVSDRYTFIPTADVIQHLMGNGFQVFHASQKLVRTEERKTFTRHMIKFRHPELSDIGEGQSLESVLVTAHDGTTLYRFLLGVNIWICMNGAIAANEMFGDVRIKHTGDVLNEALYQTYAIMDNAPLIKQHIENWKNMQLTGGEQHYLADEAYKLAFGNLPFERTGIESYKLLDARRYADNHDDLWSVFNRVQENLIHGGVTGVRPGFYDEQGNWHRSRRVRTRAVRAIDRDIKLNRGLWQLADGMAKQKLLAA